LENIQVNNIGVDVDSKFLVCHCLTEEGKFKGCKTFNNTSSGFRKLIKWATARNEKARVCMEATGVYSIPLALALHCEPLIDTAVVNPRTIKKFAEARLQRGKTDAMDAETIAEFLYRMPFRQWEPPSEEILELQLLTRRVVQLNAELTRERNRNSAAKKMGGVGRFVANDTAVNMRHIERRIETVEQECLSLISDIPELENKLSLLKSIPGIADKTGSRILAELSSLPTEMKAKQWVAYAGLDPRPYESGTSTHKPRRITKDGNRYLRNALYFPALVAYRNDPNIKAFYDKLIARGKKPIQAIVAIMRKLLLAIWGMFKSNTSWNPNKFYKMA